MAEFTYQDKRPIDDILIPGNRPGVSEHYYWYYNVTVKDENGILLSGVEMYNSSGTKVATSNNSGKISYYAGETTLNRSPSDTFTFKKVGYFQKDVTITATTGIIYTPVVMSQMQIVSNLVYFDIFVKDRLDNSPISGATINVYTDSNYSKSFVHQPSIITDDNGLGSLSTRLLSIGDTLYFQVSATGYASNKTPVIGTGPHLSEDKVSIVRLSPNAAISREYFFNIKVLDSSQIPVSGVRLRLYEDFSLSTIYSNGIVGTKTEDGLYVITEIIKDIIFSKTDLDVSILNDGYRLTDIGVDVLDIIQEIEKLPNINISDDEVKSLSTILDVAKLVQGKLPNGSITKTYDVTDEKGEIHINYGTSTTTPNPLGVKIANLPNDYVAPDPVGTVTASPLGSTTFGKTFVLQKNTELSEYSYNFQLLDSLAYVKLSGTTVVYKNPNGDEINRGITDSEGQINFNSTYPKLTISFSKNGYENYEVYSFAGNENKNFRYYQYLIPTRYIRVIDEDGEGVEDINVILWGYDQNGDYIEYKSLKTRYGGYVNPTILNENYSLYNEEVYVSINLKYSYDVSYNKTLKKIPLENTMVFEIPVPIDDGDSDVDEFEKFNEYSVNHIKKMIDKQKNIEDDNNIVEYIDNDFSINIQHPDTISVYDIFTCTPVIVNNNQKSVVGSVDVDLKPDINTLRMKMINRYSGYYNPIFKDVLFFKNINYIDEEKKEQECHFSNTSFDYTYSDDYGKFGIINNMWFHKVNDSGKDIITTLTPYYPLTGQYALDSKDYNIFSSNWDMYYHTRQLDLINSENCRNVSSMNNGLCMFGSKYLNVPEVIEINGFEQNGWDGIWNEDWITNQDACPGEIMYNEINNNSVDFYLFLTKRIIRFFKDKLRDEFKKYISGDYSYGIAGIEDDMEEYIKKNILKLYKLERVRMFVRRTKKGQHNSRIENDYNAYLKEDPNYFMSHGFTEVKTMTMTKINRNDFDRKIVYNLRRGSQEDFGFSFFLRKI